MKRMVLPLIIKAEKKFLIRICNKELFITYCRSSRPTPGASTLGVIIKHADDPEKNSIFIHRLLSLSKPAYTIMVLPLSRSVPNGTSNS